MRMAASANTNGLDILITCASSATMGTQRSAFQAGHAGSIPFTRST
jgi:hypothetical protein